MTPTMITALSVLFWFISQHPLLTFFSAMVLAGLVSWWRRFPGYAIVVFPLATVSYTHLRAHET